MENKSKHWKNTLIFSIMVVTFVTIGLHMTPSLSLRTTLFFSGYFNEAFHAKLIPVKSENSQSNLYTVEPAPFEKATHSELKTFEVKKIFIFYSASYYGEV